jgi:hypothetical protein
MSANLSLVTFNIFFHNPNFDKISAWSQTVKTINKMCLETETSANKYDGGHEEETHHQFTNKSATYIHI